MTIDPGLCSILIFHKRDWKYFLHHVLCMIFQEKCFSYVLLTGQISLSDCLYFLRYWAICVLQLFVSQVINFEINLIFLIRQFFYVTKKSRQNLNILRTEKAWRTRWRLSTILIASNKSVSTVFWYVKVYINSEFWKFIQYTIHWDKTQNVKKISFGQNKRFKKFLSRAPTHHSFTFNSQFLYELHLSKTVCGIFYFRFCLVFVKLYTFVQQKV